jgi:hypothetical protein
MYKILNTRGPVAMEDDNASVAKSPSLPNPHGGGICYLSQTESLNDRKKAGFQVVNSALEPAVFSMFTDAL